MTDTRTCNAIFADHCNEPCVCTLPAGHQGSHRDEQAEANERPIATSMGEIASDGEDAYYNYQATRRLGKSTRKGTA